MGCAFFSLPCFIDRRPVLQAPAPKGKQEGASSTLNIRTSGDHRFRGDKKTQTSCRPLLASCRSPLALAARWDHPAKHPYTTPNRTSRVARFGPGQQGFEPRSGGRVAQSTGKHAKKRQGGKFAKKTRKPLSGKNCLSARQPILPASACSTSRNQVVGVLHTRGDARKKNAPTKKKTTHR